jgi:hypothetical protein
MTATRERKAHLDNLVQDPYQTRDHISAKFLQAPLYNKDFHKNFCTLYSMQYDLEELSATAFWPNKSIKQSFDSYAECREVVNINKPGVGGFVR